MSRKREMCRGEEMLKIREQKTRQENTRQERTREEER